MRPEYTIIDDERAAVEEAADTVADVSISVVEAMLALSHTVGIKRTRTGNGSIFGLTIPLAKSVAGEMTNVLTPPVATGKSQVVALLRCQS